MIKNDIALAIEKKSDLSRAKSLAIVEAILDALKKSLAEDEKIEIRGFASLKVVSKKTGYGRDIRRKKQIKIKKGKRIKFRPGQDLKNLSSLKDRQLHTEYCFHAGIEQSSDVTTDETTRTTVSTGAFSSWIRDIIRLLY